MIILIGNEKGGVGKSTIAVNLAVQQALLGKEVVIVDTDKQRTSANFVTTRNSNELKEIICIEKTGDVFNAVKSLDSKYDVVIIDAGGQDSEELRSAMVAADIMLIPLRPSQIDLWAIERMNKLISNVISINRNLIVRTVISIAPTNHFITEQEDATQMLLEYKHLNLIDAAIFDRKVYRDGFIQGRGVIEMDNQKAKDEIIKLSEIVFSKEKELCNV